ncbi:hypothetical protein BH09MYX1_BH09MYX1_66560 [soil metagenome]
MRLALFASASFALALFATRAAHAESKPSSLGWVHLDGADSCIAAQALSRAVEARLGHAVFVSPSDAVLSVEGRIGPVTGEPDVKWRATLTLRGKDGAALGNRTMDGADALCSSLDDKLALAIALMIDPDALAHKDPPKEPPIVPPKDPEPKIIYVSVPAPPPPPKPTWQVEPTAGVAMVVGLTPQLGLAVVGAATVESPIRFVGFRVSGQFVFPNGVDLPIGHAEVWIAKGSASYCPLVGEAGRFYPRACIGGSLGVFHANGEGLTSSRSGDTLLVDGHIEVLTSYRIVGPLVVGVQAMLALNLIRGQVTYTDSTGAELVPFRMGLFSFTGGVFVGMHFP